MNRRVDIWKDIKRYQDTLSYASSKVDYSVGEHVYMLSSNMTLKIKTGTVGYNNKILVSDGKFILGKNEKVNAGSANSLETPANKNHKDLAQISATHRDSEKTSAPHRDLEKNIISHEDEKVALVLSLNGIFMTWFIF